MKNNTMNTDRQHKRLVSRHGQRAGRRWRAGQRWCAGGGGGQAAVLGRKQNKAVNSTLLGVMPPSASWQGSRWTCAAVFFECVITASKDKNTVMMHNSLHIRAALLVSSHSTANDTAYDSSEASQSPPRPRHSTQTEADNEVLSLAWELRCFAHAEMHRKHEMSEN